MSNNVKVLPSQVQLVSLKQPFPCLTRALPSIDNVTFSVLYTHAQTVCFFLQKYKYAKLCALQNIFTLLKKLPSLAFMSIFSLEAFRPGFRPRFPLSLRSYVYQ